MSNVANIVQNGIAGPVYLVDGNGNPISTTNPFSVNASFSASSISINDPTTTTNKATVDGSGNLHVAIAGPLAAGTNVIGHVIVDSAGNVSITSLPSLPAGSAVIGHVIVDSASSVAVSSLPTLPSGTNLIGHVVVDSAGSVSVTSLPSLPAGTNVIGHVVVDSGAVTNTQPDTTGSGTITAAQPSIGTPVSNATVTLALGTGQSSWGAVLSGTFSAGSTIVVDHSRDGGTTWIASSFKVSGGLQNTTVQSVVGGATTEINGNDAGVSHIRVRCSVLAGGDNISVAIRAGYGVGGVGLLSSIPAGNNLIGGMNVVDSAGTNKLAVNASGQVTEANSASIATNTSTTATNTGNIPAKGQATMANSTPVVIASNQSNVNVAVNAALPAGSALVGGVEIYDSAGTNKLVIDSSGRLTLVPNQSANIAQIGGSSVALGQAAMASSIPVVIANNQSGVPITQPTSATGTITSVVSAAASTQLLASNASRKGAYFYNDSTAILYLALAGSASTSAYTVQIPAQGFFEIPTSPVYTGAVFGIWGAANGNARITEMS